MGGSPGGMTMTLQDDDEPDGRQTELEERVVQTRDAIAQR
jgi:hypothetical protein